MSIAELTIRKKTVSFVFTLLIFFGGISAYQGLGRLEDPVFTIKDAVIITAYPGASPMEVADEVTDTIETALQQLPQLKEVSSISKEGLSIITATMKDRYDAVSLPQVWDEMRRKIRDVSGELPPGVYPSIIRDDYGDVYGILLALSGDGYTETELRDYAKFLRKELLLVKDVAKIELWGIQQEAVFVEISRTRMAQLGVGLDVIQNALVQQNMVSPAGNVQVGPEYIRIDTTGTFGSVADIANLQIRDPRSDRIFYLRDVATISRGMETPPSNRLHFNGKTAISIGISIVPEGNVVELGTAINTRLAELETDRPIGIDIGVINFQPHDVELAVNGFVVNFLGAVAIVVVVLLIFMGLKSGLLIGVILALTVLGTMIFMDIMDITLQRISLGALVIALGMLVDNAIVVTEGMMIRIGKGENGRDAAVAVVGQNLMPLLGATVIGVLAFAAVGLSQDMTGEYCRSLFQVMLISLMFSWLVAITLTPLFCTMIFKPQPKGDENGEADPYRGIVFVLYKGFLAICLRYRWLTVGCMVILLGLAVYTFTQLKNNFFPNSAKPMFTIHYWLPAGTDIRQTTGDIAEIETWLTKDERIASIASYIGAGAPRFMLTFAPEKSMDKGYGVLLVTVHDNNDIDALLPTVYDYITQRYPDAEPKVEKFILGAKLGGSIEVRFSGKDPNVLRRLSEEAKAIFRADPQSYAVRDDWRQRVKAIRPIFDESKARTVGITRRDLNTTLEATFKGRRVGIFREKDELIPIVLRAPEAERLDVENLKDIQIWSPVTRKSVPLSQVVSRIETVWEDSLIHRLDRKLTITASCEPTFGILASNVFERTRPAIEAMTLPPGYTMEWGGDFEGSADARAGLMSSMPVTILLMVLIIIMLFNALRQPLIIWLTVPLAIIGVSFGLMAFDLPFDFMALLGFLSLTGMLIKNAIVLLDQIDLEIREGGTPHTAIVHSCLSRLRPVSMAAFTTVLGMIPLLTDVFFRSMAVTIMAGLTFATILTLVVVPVLYAIFFHIHEDRQGGVQ